MRKTSRWTQRRAWLCRRQALCGDVDGRFSRHTSWRQVRGAADAEWHCVDDWATPQRHTALLRPTLVVQAFELIWWVSKPSKHRRRRLAFIGRSTSLVATSRLLPVSAAKRAPTATWGEPASAMFSEVSSALTRCAETSSTCQMIHIAFCVRPSIARHSTAAPWLAVLLVLLTTVNIVNHRGVPMSPDGTTSDTHQQ